MLHGWDVGGRPKASIGRRPRFARDFFCATILHVVRFISFMASRFSVIALCVLAMGLTAAAALAPLATVHAQDANETKARALINSAIQMTNSDDALKLLWQATDVDPQLTDSYLYLGLYYNSRENFPKVVEVYRKLLKYRPKEVSAYLNIGEAYMSFSPPNYDDALQYFRKAYSLDPSSALAALRIGEILAHQGQRNEAILFLTQAVNGAKTKDPSIAAEAQKVLGEIASH